MIDPIAVILAAGQGKRMKSDLPKVLHPICKRPMIEYVLEAVRTAGVKRILIVVGYKADEVKTALSGHADVAFTLQSEQKGTGHAVMVCEQQLAGHNGPVLVLAGDMPLLKGKSLVGLLEELQSQNAACVIGTTETDANKGLGRIVRSEQSEFLKIVEEKDATPEEKAIREINTGCYAFDGPSLLEALSRIRPDNQQAEYYLTDCPAILKQSGKTVIASKTFEMAEAMGINTPEQLADVERIMERR
ncbi:MAG: NTP transferase domain-containing protein [Planctomycetes bacterium]|nr:NTP transferase domain-containing protein [Planctomycetota bacterium]